MAGVPSKQPPWSTDLGFGRPRVRQPWAPPSRGCLSPGGCQVGPNCQLMGFARDNANMFAKEISDKAGSYKLAGG